MTVPVSKADLLARLNPAMTAMDTFRVVATSPNSNDGWVRSAHDNLIRELQAVLATEETKRLEEISGILRDVLTQLEDSVGEFDLLAGRIRETLGVMPVPPDVVLPE